MGMSETATSDGQTAEQPDKEPERSYLFQIGGDREGGLPSVPLLPPYYAYLIKISEGVSLVDIYPFLAEIMFHSQAVCPEADKDENKVRAANIISIFIDDQRDNIANTMLPSEEDIMSSCTINMTPQPDPFLTRCLYREKNADTRPRNFVVDTFGRFGAPNLNEGIETSVGCADDSKSLPVYLRTSLVGAGNPMRMMQRFRSITNLDKMPPFQESGPCAEVGQINCFLLNSISYLYRTMGFRDAMLLVRQMLERGVWKPSGSGKTDDSRIISKDGLLFAILHEGVFREDEIRYAETFFDAVINFKSFSYKRKRFVTYQFDLFPVVDTNAYKDDARFLPDFDKQYAYLPIGGANIHAVPLTRFGTPRGATEQSDADDRTNADDRTKDDNKSYGSVAELPGQEKKALDDLIKTAASNSEAAQ